MITDAYANLSEVMKTKEISETWEAVKDDISIVEAVDNRLSDLDFDDEEY